MNAPRPEELLLELAEAVDKDRGHDKSLLTRIMREVAAEVAVLRGLAERAETALAEVNRLLVSGHHDSRVEALAVTEDALAAAGQPQDREGLSGIGTSADAAPPGATGPDSFKETWHRAARRLLDQAAGLIEYNADEEWEARAHGLVCSAWRLFEDHSAGDRPPEHDIGSPVYSEERDIYYAECSCGWQSPLLKLPNAVRAASEEHLRAAVPRLEEPPDASSETTLGR